MVFYCVDNKRLFALGTVLFLLMCISGIYALGDVMSDVENGLSTSSVDISIEEYNKNNEIFYEDGKNVSPGDEIVLIPRINNLGIDCYIRAKITYKIANDNYSELDYINGLYSSWTKKEDYYYYGSVLKKGTSVDLFNKVLIPSYLSSEYFGKQVAIHIVVEAVQARNFEGNWDEVEISKSIDRSYDIDYNGSSSVVYEDDTDNHITLNNNFFGNLGNMLPGDNVFEKFNLLNSSKNNNRYYLAINYDGMKEDEIELLKKIKLSIKNSKGKVLVDSNLYDKTKHSLGEFGPGFGDAYVVELSLPKDTTNEYSKLFTKILWKFSYENLDQQDDEEKPDSRDSTPNNDNNPKTSDFVFDRSITVFLLSTLGFIVTIVLDKMNKDKIEK